MADNIVMVTATHSLLARHKTSFAKLIAPQRAGGFTLLELLFVLTIASGIVMMLLNYRIRVFSQQRINTTAFQMQQILNAGLAYYAAFNTWPVTCDVTLNSSGNINSSSPTQVSATSLIITSGYLPSSFANNTYGNAYYIDCNASTGVFYVITNTPNQNVAKALSGMVPVAYTSNSSGMPTSTSPTYVTAQITMPGMILNNARAINFASLYANDSCVPVPSCPAPGMTAQIIVVPASIAGVTDGYDSNYADYNSYPLTAFHAFALAPGAVSNTLADCEGNSTPTACGSNVNTGAQVWRVCLQVFTQNGLVSGTTNTNMQQVFALTRCAPANESS